MEVFLFPENEFANFGFSGNDDMSFDWYKFSYLWEAYFGFGITRALELDANLLDMVFTPVKLTLKILNLLWEYKTSNNSCNLRLRMSPWDMEAWNPYLYIGAGVMSFDLTTKPSGIPGGEPTNDAGWSGILPLGIG
ncbi:MAG: hypothetical protein U5J96_07325 [Ignavibacteriaceae bacterium]|nr:hypothetical protein [Ignavibacteriaceae bacterium]